MRAPFYPLLLAPCYQSEELTLSVAETLSAIGRIPRLEEFVRQGEPQLGPFLLRLGANERPIRASANMLSLKHTKPQPWQGTVPTLSCCAVEVPRSAIVIAFPTMRGLTTRAQVGYPVGLDALPAGQLIRSISRAA